ncbi:MAG: FKBP-type peptidyl-prolyl cis-trans isomerase [Gammaproteobacteria bacterium]|nr:FKBP-type peptidyl-prolyl cis-trans isomerase [Gammaproteobacteria bacterium]
MNAWLRSTVMAAALSCCALQAGAQETALPEAPPDEPLVITDLALGIGDEALPGMVCVVHYTGWLYDRKAQDQRGHEFDDSHKRGRPFSFPLGGRHVIKGWDLGVVGMRVGGLRRLVIPPALAYGDRNVGNGAIPPGSTLLFEIELLAVETVTVAPQAQ